MSDPSKCPVIHGAITSPNAGRTNQDWWPEQLNLSILHQHDKKSCPMDDDFEYRKEFEKLDYFALKDDIRKLMTDSKVGGQPDYGHYGPFFIRMTWHPQVHIEQVMVEEAEVLDPKDLLQQIAGLITQFR